MAQRATTQLVGAVQDFQDSLTSLQNQDFFASYSGIPSKHNGVSIFVAQIDLSNQRRTFRCLASRMQGSLQSVEQFSKVVDTFVPSRPPIGASIRGILRYTINLASHHASFFERLSDWFVQTQAYCPQLRDYEFIYRDAFRLQEALCSFYAIMIDFCTHAVHFIGESGVGQHGHRYWTPIKKDFADYASLLQRRQRDVKDEIREASDQAVQRDYQLQIAERQKAEEAGKYPRILRLKFDRLVNEDRAWKRQVQMRDAKLRKERLLDKLSLYDYLLPLNREREKRYGSTATWLPKTRQFQDWIANNESPSFWLSGGSGSGKTVVTSAVVDSLLIWKGEETLSVSYFFCQYNNDESLKARTLLGSLIRQLTEDSLRANLETYLEQILSHEPLDTEDIKGFILKVVTEASEKQVILIDGFDEMACDQRSVVLSVLRHLSDSAGSKTKIFISSRPDIGEELELALPKLCKRTMNCHYVVKDVATYIKLALVEKAEIGLLKIGDNALLPIIEQMLTEKANGNFLWAFFQIEELCTQTSDDDIYKALAVLPEDLPETIRRSLRRIARNHKEGIAAMMFFWTAAARRPLTLLEMREAIAVYDNQTSLDERHLVPNVDKMVSWCEQLLVLDEEEKVVRFVHQTVKRYLFTVSEDPQLDCFHFHIDRIDWEAGKACCTYLALDDFSKPVAQTPRSHSGGETNGTRDSSPKANGNTVISRSMSTIQSIRKVRPPSIGNILQLVQESPPEKSLNEKPTPPIEKPKPQQLFRAYASEYWLYHTSTIQKDDSHYRIWRRLVLAPNTVASKPFSWTSRTWSEPEDAALLKAIVDLNHGALLDFAIEMHVAQTQYLPFSPKFRSILLYIAQHGPTPLFLRLMDWESTMPFSLWGDTFDAALAGGQVATVKLLLSPDSWETEPFRFTSRGTRLDLVDNLTITNKAARARIDQARAKLQYAGSLSALKLLMTIQAEKEGTAVGYLELLDACGRKDEPYVERILAAGIDPRAFPRHEYRAIKAVMREKGDL